MKRHRSFDFVIIACCLAAGAAARGDDAFATTVIDYDPAPGQFVNDSDYNDPASALGWPSSDDPQQPNNNSLVSLGGFGGSITLAFDHTVRDDPANPFGLDAIVYGNAIWVSGNPNRKWGECGVIEISRDVNSNGLADDPWYLIPGSHIAPLPSQSEMQTWDDLVEDPTWPPDDALWIPPGRTGTWITQGYRLPPEVFETETGVIANPNGPGAIDEGVIGYADLSPTQGLPVGQEPATFYTRPDNPFVVGLTPGSGGGDAFDIAWAIDPATWQPAGLDGFDFIRITTGVNHIIWPLGELSTEIDAAVDVAEGRLGDAENDGDVDLDDYAIFATCVTGPNGTAPPSPCRVMDFDQGGSVDLADYAGLQRAFTGG